MVLWRVFGVSDVFTDRPAATWLTESKSGPGEGDRLQLTLGELPGDLTQCLRQWRAQASGLLDMLLGQHTSPTQLLTKYEHELAVIELPEFEPRHPQWLTLRLARNVHIRAKPGAIVGWVDADHAYDAALTKFSQDGSTFLDGAVANVVGGAGAQLNIGLLVHGDRRALLTAPGRAATRTPSFQLNSADSGISIIRSEGWAGAPTGSLAAALKELPSGEPISSTLTSPARLFCAARAERTDDFRRFVFAFAGLEVLVTKLEIAARDRLVTRLLEADESLPVTELFWPGTNNDFVVRNVVFRFAAVAAVLSPVTAKADVKLFKSLARARNDVYHGKDHVITRALSVQSTELLKRYLGLVATDLVS